MQFALHYLFENRETFENLFKIVDGSLRVGGHWFFTTFDGRELTKLLDSKRGASKPVELRWND